jgi:hypothetical protein
MTAQEGGKTNPKWTIIYSEMIIFSWDIVSKTLRCCNETICGSVVIIKLYTLLLLKVKADGD